MGIPTNLLNTRPCTFRFCKTYVFEGRPAIIDSDSDSSNFTTRGQRLPPRKKRKKSTVGFKSTHSNKRPPMSKKVSKVSNQKHD